MYKVLVTDRIGQHSVYSAKNFNISEGFLILEDAMLLDGNPEHVRTFVTAIKTDEIAVIAALEDKDGE